MPKSSRITEELSRSAMPAASEFGSQKIAGLLARSILQGDFAPGARLPGELELTERFLASRSVIREALKTVAAKGLIEARKKAGTRVRERDQWQMLDPQMLEWRLGNGPEEKLILDLLQMREVIEPAAAAAAAQSRSPAALAVIDGAFRRMTDAQHDPETFIDPDLAFHKAILAGTGNDFFVAFGSLIEASLRVFLRVSALHKGAPRPSLPLHEAVLEAIRNRKPRQADAAMTRLMRLTRGNVERNLKAVRR